MPALPHELRGVLWPAALSSWPRSAPCPRLDGDAPQAASGHVPGRYPFPRVVSFDEAAEPEAVVNVVYYRHPAWRQRRPYRAEFEARVARGMQAVMNE